MYGDHEALRTVPKMSSANEVPSRRTCWASSSLKPRKSCKSRAPAVNELLFELRTKRDQLPKAPPQPPPQPQPVVQPVPPKTLQESRPDEEPQDANETENVTHSAVDMQLGDLLKSISQLRLLNAGAPEGSADGDSIEASAARTYVTHYFRSLRIESKLKLKAAMHFRAVFCTCTA